MKTLVLTGYDDAYAPLGDLTAPRMLAYASDHNYDFQCFRDCPSGIESSWHKIEMVLNALTYYERVFWIDADIMITNPTISHDYRNGFFASLDWGVDATRSEHFSAGAFVICRDTGQMLAEVMRQHEHCVSLGMWEQQPMRELYQRYEHSMHILPRRTLNAVAPEVHPSAPEPWQPGDWAVHFTMLPIADRVDLFRKYKRMILDPIVLEKISDIESKMHKIKGEPCGRFARDCSNPKHEEYFNLTIERDRLRSGNHEAT